MSEVSRPGSGAEETQPVDLDEVQRLIDAATPGPWGAVKNGLAQIDGRDRLVWRGHELVTIVRQDAENDLDPGPDAEFIAAAAFRSGRQAAR